MKAIFYNVIAGGDYDLTEMLARIDGYHIEGKLTDAERERRGRKGEQLDAERERRGRGSDRPHARQAGND